jgi:5'-phosphate synthase pdxT subunit
LPRIGVLAIQGDFLEHQQVLSRVAADAPEIRLPRELNDIDGLIIPGGESTTIVQLIDIFDFRQPLADKVNSGMPVWGTCAGMIVLANRLTDHRPDPLKLMDIEVSRNAFGRQVDSFEVDLPILGIEGGPVHAVFIRAPLIRSVEPNVRVIGRLDDGTIVAARQGNMLATAFHPELTGDSRVHRLFIDMVRETADRGTELIRNAV